MYYSEDGKNWYKAIVQYKNVGITGIVFGNGVFVGGTSDNTYCSSNGKKWLRVTSYHGNKRIYNIVYGSNDGVFVGSTGVNIYYSTEPITRSELDIRILQTQYPVGSMIKLQNKTNPLSYLGFGIWKTHNTQAPYTYTRTQ